MERSDIYMSESTEQGRGKALAALGLIASALAVTVAVGVMPAAAYAEENEPSADLAITVVDETNENVALTEKETSSQNGQNTENNANDLGKVETTQVESTPSTAQSGGNPPTANGDTPQTPTTPETASSDLKPALTLNAQGGSLSTGEITTEYAVGDTVVLPDASNGTYIFVGWNTESDGSGTMYEAGATFTITENATLYAIWKEAEPEAVEAEETAHYTVQFDANDGTIDGESVLMVEAAENTSIILPEPVREGYSFVGWSASDASFDALLSAGDGVTITQNATFYAVWAQNAAVVHKVKAAGLMTAAATQTQTISIFAAAGLASNYYGNWHYADGSANPNTYWAYFPNAASIYLATEGATIDIPARTLLIGAFDGSDKRQTKVYSYSTGGNSSVYSGLPWWNVPGRTNIQRVYTYGGIQPTNMSHWFGFGWDKGIPSCTDLYLGGIDTSECVTLDNLFYDSYHGMNLHDTGDWDTSKVTSYGGFFYYACRDGSSLTGLDFRNWNMIPGQNNISMFARPNDWPRGNINDIYAGNGVVLEGTNIGVYNNQGGGLWKAAEIVGESDITQGMLLTTNQLITYYPKGGNTHGTVHWYWYRGATTWTVSYSTNGGSGSLSSQQVMAEAGSCIYLPPSGVNAAPTWDSVHTFVGWNTKADGTGTDYAPGELYYVTGNITLYAKWALVADVIVTYNHNSNDVAGTLHAATGSTPGYTGSPLESYTVESCGFARPGYNFVGWYLKKDVVDYKTAAAGATSYSPGQLTTLPNGVQAAVSEFGLGEQKKIGDKYYLYVDLYAIWTPGYYAVQYDTQGGTPPIATKTSVSWESTDLIPSVIPERSGYEIDYWYVDNPYGPGELVVEEGKKYGDFAATDAAGTFITLKAKWKEAIYYITYTIAESDADYGDLYKQSTDPEPAENNKWADDVQAFSGVAYGGYAVAKTGYHFTGWTNNINAAVFTNPTLTGAQVAGVAFYGGVWHTATFTAHFEANTYTIKYDNNATYVNGMGGTPYADATGTLPDDIVAWGQDHILATGTGIMILPGYTLAGWNTQQDGAGTDYSQGQTVTNMTTTNGATITLYAVWTQATSHIVFKAATGGKITKWEGGSMTTEVTDLWDQSIGTATGELEYATATPATGYHFLYWTDSTNSIVSNNATFKPMKPASGVWPDNELYTAYFTANTYIVRYDINGGSYDTVNFPSPTYPPYPSDQSFTYGVPQSLTNVYDDPTTPFVTEGIWREGYTFGGWKYTYWTQVAHEVDDTTSPVMIDDPDNPGTMIQKTVEDPDNPGTFIPVYNKKTVFTWEQKTKTFANAAMVSNLSSELYVDDSTMADDYDGAATQHIQGVAELVAIWDPVTYTIVFKPGIAGTVGTTETMTCDFDVEYNLSKNGFKRNGYTFLGWSYDLMPDVMTDATWAAFVAANPTTTFTDEQAIKNLTSTAFSTITMYGAWKYTTYKVTFENPETWDATSFGGTATDPRGGMTPNNGNPEDVVYGGNATTPTLFDTTSNRFAFSYWTYVTYLDDAYDEDGNLLADEDIPAGSKIENTIPYEDISSIVIYGTTTFAAHWELPSYTVSYDPGDHGTFLTGELNYTWFKSEPGDDTAYTNTALFAGFSFGGAIKSSMVTHADYTKYYDLATTNNQNVRLPAAEAGYRFLYWTWTVDGVDYTSDVDPWPTCFADTQGSVVFTAVYEPRSQLLSFDVNGGIDQGNLLPDGSGNAVLDTRTIKTGSTTILPGTADVKRKGYDLDGWSLTADGEAEWGPGAVFTMPGQNTKLYAHWKARTYQIYYDTLGGSDVEFIEGPTTAGQTLTANLRSGVTWTQTGFISDVTEPTKPGYIFVGWYDTLGGGTDLAKISDSMTFEGIAPTKITGERDDTPGVVAILYAKWVEADAVIYYIPSYETTVGDEKKLVKADEGKKGYVTMESERLGSVTGVPAGSSAFSYTGYKFLYWAMQYETTVTDLVWDEDAGDFVEVTSTVNVIDIVLDDSGDPVGYELVPTKGVYNAYAGLYNIWNVNGNAKDGYCVYYYAVFEPIKYIVRFNANDGFGSIEDMLFEYDEAQNLTSNWMNEEKTSSHIARSGYKFLGWNTEPTGAGTSYADAEEVINLTDVDGDVVTLYAMWEAADRTVIFHPNFDGYEEAGFAIITRDDVSTGDVIMMPTTSTYYREGYDLLGWCESPTGAGVIYAPGTNYTVPALDVTFYAIWKPFEYKIIFKEGASDVTGTMSDLDMVYGVPRALLTNKYAREGYVFVGWSTEIGTTDPMYYDEEIVNNLTNIAGGVVTLYAVWYPKLYTVTFQSSDTSRGTVTATPQSVFINSYIDINGVYVEEKEGYDLIGWTYVTVLDDGSKITGTVAYPQTVPIKGTTVFTALFGTRPTVMYLPGLHGAFVGNVSGATLYESPTVDYNTYLDAYPYGGAIDAFGKPKGQGNYEFMYWLDQDGRKYYWGEKWIDVDGTEYSWELPNTPMVTVTHPLYILTAVWYAAAYVVLDPDPELATDPALWTDKLTEAPAAAGTSDIVSLTLNAADKYIVPDAKDVVRPGYHLEGWATVSGGPAVYAPGAAVTLGDETLYLYAVWSLNHYALSFETFGGTYYPTVPGVTWYQTGLIPPTNPVKTGYVFGGWALDSSDLAGSLLDLSDADNIPFSVIAGGVTEPARVVWLYAYWVPTQAVIVYEPAPTEGGGVVLVNPPADDGDDDGDEDEDGEEEPDPYYNGPGVYEVVDADTGTPEGAIATPAPGYHFVGWYDADGNLLSSDTKFVPTKGETEAWVDTTYYAKFAPNVYYIIFDGNGGVGSMAPMTMTYGVGKSLTHIGSKITNPGYTFLGWSLDPDATSATWGDGAWFTGLDITDELLVDGTYITLYAIWNNVGFRLYYNANGGSGSVASGLNGNVYKVGQEVTLADSGSMSRYGYLPLRWNTSADGSGTNYEFGDIFIMPNYQATLYMMWKPIAYTLHFDTGAAGVVGNDVSDATHLPDVALTFTQEYTLPSPGWTLVGRQFDYWMINGKKYNAGSNVSKLTGTDGATVTAIAIWKPIPVPVYWVSEDTTKATVTGVSSVKWGEKLPKSAYTFTRVDGAEVYIAYWTWTMDTATGTVTSEDTYAATDPSYPWLGKDSIYSLVIEGATTFTAHFAPTIRVSYWAGDHGAFTTNNYFTPGSGGDENTTWFRYLEPGDETPAYDGSKDDDGYPLGTVVDASGRMWLFNGWTAYGSYDGTTFGDFIATYAYDAELPDVKDPGNHAVFYVANWIQALIVEYAWDTAGTYVSGSVATFTEKESGKTIFYNARPNAATPVYAGAKAYDGNPDGLDGWVFAGWTNPGGAVVADGAVSLASITATADIVYRASWDEAWIIRYIFDTPTDDDKADFTIDENGKTKFGHTVKNAATPDYAGAKDSSDRPKAKSGYYFAGWKNATTGDVYYFGGWLDSIGSTSYLTWDPANMPATANVDYVAVWWKLYSVTYDPGEHGGGWANNVDDRTYFDDVERSTGANTVYVPAYGANLTSNTTYFDVKGSPLGAKGYVFAGWKAFDGSGAEITADLTTLGWDLSKWNLSEYVVYGDVFPQDIKFVAQWDVATYTLVYDRNAPSDETPWALPQPTKTQAIKYGDTDNLYPVDYTSASTFYGVNGYTFVGWLTKAGLTKWGSNIMTAAQWASFTADGDNTGLWYADGDPFTVAIGSGATYDQEYTLYAMWSRNRYDVDLKNDYTVALSNVDGGTVYLTGTTDEYSTKVDYYDKLSIAETDLEITPKSSYQLWGWLFTFTLDDGTTVDKVVGGYDTTDGNYADVIAALNTVNILGNCIIRPIWDTVYDVLYTWYDNGGFTTPDNGTTWFTLQRRSQPVTPYAGEFDGSGLPLGAAGYVFQYWYIDGYDDNDALHFTPAQLAAFASAEDLFTYLAEQGVTYSTTTRPLIKLVAAFEQAQLVIKYNPNIPPLSLTNPTQSPYTQNALFDTEYDLMYNTFTANGYKFAGWVTDPDKCVFTETQWSDYIAAMIHGTDYFLEDALHDPDKITVTAPSGDATYGYVHNLYAAWIPRLYEVLVIDGDTTAGVVSGSPQYLKQDVYYGFPIDPGDIDVTLVGEMQLWGWGWSFTYDDVTSGTGKTTITGETEGPITNVTVLGEGTIWPIFDYLYAIIYKPGDHGTFTEGEDGSRYVQRAGDGVKAYNVKGKVGDYAGWPVSDNANFIFKGWMYEEAATFYEIWLYNEDKTDYTVEVVNSLDGLADGSYALISSWDGFIEHIIYAHDTAFGDKAFKVEDGIMYVGGSAFPVPVGGITFTALWAPEKVTLTFDPNGGTLNLSEDQLDLYKDYYSYDPVKLPGEESASRSGYTLVGWNTMADGSGYAFGLDVTIPMFDEDTTLYAMWKEKIAAIYYSSTIYGMDVWAGAIIEGYEQSRGLASDAPWVISAITDPVSGLVRPAYGFYILAVSGLVVTEDGELVLDGDGNPISIYSVTAEANNGYHFLHWITDAGRITTTSNTYTAEVDPDTGLFIDTIFWGVFTEDDDVVIEYRVSNPDAGWVYRSYELIAPYTEEPRGTTVYAREGYTFLHWYYYDESGNYTIVSEPDFLYTRAKVGSPASYSSNADAGKVVGVDFKPWRGIQYGEDAVTPTTDVNWTFTSRVYYAQFAGVAVNYTVEYWLQGTDGTYTKASSVVYGNRKTEEWVYMVDDTHPYKDLLDADDNPADFGAFNPTTFAGYKFDAASSTTFGKALPDGSLVLSLYYDLDRYKLTYQYRHTDKTTVLPTDAIALPAGADALLPSPATSSHYYNEVIVLAGKPTLPGYEFEGWFLDGATFIAGTDDMLYMPDHNVYVYGVWKPVGYEVKFEIDVPATIGTLTVSNPYTTDGDNKLVSYGDKLTSGQMADVSVTETDPPSFVLYGWRWTMYDPSDGVTELASGVVLDPTEITILGPTTFIVNWAQPLYIAYLPGEHGTFDSGASYFGTLYQGLHAYDPMKTYRFYGTSTGAVASKGDASISYYTPAGETGYNFAGWRWQHTDDDSSSPDYGKTTYYIWIANVDKAAAGTTGSAEEAYVNTILARLMSLYGYASTEISVVYDEDMDTDTVRYSRTMSAFWMPQTHKLTIDSNKGTFYNGIAGYVNETTTESNYETGYNATLYGSDVAYRAGYVMDGFSLVPEGDPGYQVDFLPSSTFVMVGYDITLYIHWSEGPDVSIIYASAGNGTTGPVKEWVAPATGVPTGSTAIPAAGYKFLKWTDASGNEVGDGTATLIPTLTMVGLDVWPDGITFTAWFTEADPITIVYKAGDGGKVLEVGSFTSEVTTTSETLLPVSGTVQGTTAVAAPGYEFIGWYRDGVIVQLKNSDGDLVDAGPTLVPGRVSGAYEAATYTAMFKAKEVEYVIKHYKVTEDAMGAQTVELFDVEKKTGTVGTTATATPKAIAGFDDLTTFTITGPYTFTDSTGLVPTTTTLTGDGSELVLLSGTITVNSDGDGNLVLSVYYKVSSLRLTIVLNAAKGEALATGLTDTWTGDYVVNTVVNLPSSTQAVRSGYTLAGWSETEDDTTGFWAYTMGTSSVDLYPVWVAKTDTIYNVYYVLRDKSGTEITVPGVTSPEAFTGTTGDTVTATAISIDGFTYNDTASAATKTGTIAGDGSLKLYLYYDAAKQTVKFDPNGGSWAAGTADATKEFDEYTNETIYFPAEGTTAGRVYREGYELLGWSLDPSATTATWSAGGSGLMPGFSTNPGVIYAVWNALPNTPYTIRYIKVRADGTTVLSGDYLLVETGDAALAAANSYTFNSALVGTTGTTATASTSKTFPGYTYVPGFSADGGLTYEVLSGTIAGDGSLILSLYYKADAVDYIVHHIKLSQAGTTLSTEDETLPGEVAQVVTAVSKSYPGYTHYLSKVPSGGGTPITGTEYGTVPTSGTLELTVYYWANDGVQYKVQHIRIARDGTQNHLDELTFTSEVGNTVTATPLSYNGYTHETTWTTIPGGTVINGEESGTVTVDGSGDGNLVLKVYYVAMDNVAYHVYHYKVDGAGVVTLVDNTDVYYGEVDQTASITSTMQKSYLGYTYDASYADAVPSGTIAADITGAGTLILKAYYVADTHTVTFHTDSGTWAGTSFGTGTADWAWTAATDTPITLPGLADLTRDGYELTGWATTSGGTVFKAAGAAWAMPTADMDLYPVWTATTRTLVFYGGTPAQIAVITGTGPADISAKVGVSVSLPDKAGWVNPGYDFVGWSTTAGGTATYFVTDPWTMLNSGNELYAVWTPASVTYKVQHIRVTSSGVPTTTMLDEETKNGTYGATVSASSKTFNGYTYTPGFQYPTGTTLEVASGTVSVDGSGAGDLVLKLYYTAMKVTYTVNYVMVNSDGTIQAGNTETWTGPATDVGETVTAPAKTYTGYLKVATIGSYTTEESGEVAADALGNPTLVLNVYYEAQPVAYKVEHYKIIEQMDGTFTYKLEETEYAPGDLAQADAGSTVTATAKTYAGYDEDLSDPEGKRLASSVVNPDGSTVLVMTYRAKKYALTIHTGVGEWTAAGSAWGTGNADFTATVSYDADLTLPADTELAQVGYVLKGFGLMSGATSVFGSYTAGNAVTMPNNALELYPVWEAAPQLIVFIGGDTAALTDPLYPATGSNQSQGDPARADIADTNIVTGYVWTVTDNDNPGFVRKGYNFKGWRAADGTLYAVGDSFTVGPTDADNELTAEWEEKEFEIEYWTKWNGHASNAKAFTRTFKWTDSIDLPTKAEMALDEGISYTGYSLKGWYKTALGFGASISAGTTVASYFAGDDTLTSKKVYAVWTVLKVKVVYVDNASGDQTEMELTWSETVTNKLSPSRMGYSLKGWYKTALGFGAAYTATTKASDLFNNNDLDTSSAKKVYAIWKPSIYKVQYEVDGGESLAHPTVEYTWTQTGLSNPSTTKAGYTFEGWYTGLNGTGLKIEPFMRYCDITAADDPSSVVPLYAYWVAI